MWEWKLLLPVRHFEELERAWDDMYASRYGICRTYVVTVIYRYLDCGDLHMGFARARSEECGHNPRSHVSISWQAQINALKALLNGVTRSGSDITFKGVNVRINNGTGTTDGNVNGLGKCLTYIVTEGTRI